MSKKSVNFIVHCPSNSLKNGGAETLHQFAYHLKKNNFNVFLNYFPDEKVDLPDNLIEYNIPRTYFVDDPYHINIIPEVKTARTKYILKGKIIVYWLSVDGYYRRSLDAPFWKNWNYYRKTLSDRVFLFKLRKYSHLANSYYAKDFLKKKQINSFELKGYISNFFNGEFDIKNKKNTILYNPAKDRFHIKKVKKFFPNYNFTALENLDKFELRKLYLSSKIYLDFGTHPGRERMPREAASMGCVILVANRGSVCNDFDVPIENIYKIDINNKNLFKKLGHLVDDIFENYEKHLIKFENYRNKISYKNEYQLFDNKVLEFANKMVEDIKF